MITTQPLSLGCCITHDFFYLRVMNNVNLEFLCFLVFDF